MRAQVTGQARVEGIGISQWVGSGKRGEGEGEDTRESRGFDLFLDGFEACDRVLVIQCQLHVQKQ